MKKINIIYLFFVLLLFSGCSHGDQLVAKNRDTISMSCDIIFSGDFMQHMPQVDSARRGDRFDYGSTLKNIAPYWKSADFTVINLETTLTNDSHYTGYPMFRSPVAIAGALREAGITHCALANNHSMDNGIRGVKQTTAALSKASLHYLGVALDDGREAEITLLKKRPFRVALLNYTYGTNGMPIPAGVRANLIDTVLIKRHLAIARDSAATHVIAFMHWGNEYQRRSSAEQRQLAFWLRSHGVDVVVGSHPHVVQEIDNKNKIVYSLGNFVSNQRERYKNGGISVRVTLYADARMPAIRFLPHWVDSSYNIVFDNQGAMEQSIEDSRQAVRL